eukprot:SAG11_NODE_13574_length_649_cov_0.709091_1_plen_37_part_01
MPIVYYGSYRALFLEASNAFVVPGRYADVTAVASSYF